MSWLNDLYLTYENNHSMVAKDLEADAILLPIAHSTQNAQIEIIISERGEFLSANRIEKKDAVTIIPVTEDSASRTSGNSPHPLDDKLIYIAGDYKKFTGVDNEEKYTKYMEQLLEWNNSVYSCMQVKAIKNYVSKASIMQDLVNAKVLEVEDGKLKDSKIEGINQEEAFVRFTVEPVSLENIGYEMAVYKNQDVFEAYTQYYISLQDSIDLCYATGRWISCSDKHPSKIRRSGDKAKLVSSNDNSGFTFRGRLYESGQVASIGYETSQKAHNTLRWLIDKQGFHVGELAVVAWEISGKKIVSPDKDTLEAFYDDLVQEEEPNEYTNEAYAKKLRLASHGYRQELDTKSEVVVLGLEAATTGRLSICFYKKMVGSDFMDRILHWHKTCFWRHNYKLVKKADGTVMNPWFDGAPSPKDIAVAAFGSRNDKLIKATVERILPCIIDKRKLPVDIMKAAVARASNPNSFDKEYEHRKTVSIACALIRKKRYDMEKEEWEMALDKANRDRSYLFGRLLGAAQKLEEVALFYSGEKGRDTSAERFHQQFVRKPVKTWGIINKNLRPYIAKLKVMGKTYYNNELEEIYELFNESDFIKPDTLTELYLLGYNCQLNSYKISKEDNKDDSTENINKEKENEK